MKTKLSEVKLGATDLERVMLLPFTASTVSPNKLVLLVLELKSVIKSPTWIAPTLGDVTTKLVLLVKVPEVETVLGVKTLANCA